MKSGQSEDTPTASAGSDTQAKAVSTTQTVLPDAIAGTAPPDTSRAAATDDVLETVQEGRGQRRRDSRAAAVAAEIRDPGRYEVVGEHGRGALGRVSRARDRELGRDVAIKELLSRGKAEEQRFLREVQITARLEHPGIVPVYEAGRWPDGKPFYTMRSVSGRPLRELIAERAVEQRIGLLHHVIAVADAIAYAHGRNIVHRDLKPANVVVGEFGETIVIDWGLAKDIAASDDPVAAAPLRVPTSDDQLTVAGTILGTPAYMAPEQRRGEPVDQRADVFAIGVMLWELCSAQRPPPRDRHVRHQILRRAGIDRDLVTIIDKALEPAPERRYRDAAALAADLKAFKAGARIAARDYSLLALLVHWTRRRRALAAAIAALVVVAAAASGIYVRNVAAAEDRARRSQAATEAALGELTLKHAQTLLTTDPTASLDELAAYHGTDQGRVARIRAEATGRGVAIVRGVPQTHNVLWTAGTADGAVLSLSLDGTIARTSRDGRSTVIARGVSRTARLAYAPARHLLAYACDPADVCLFDAARAARVPAGPVLRDVKVVSLALSADATLLAVLSQSAALTLVDIADPARPSVRTTSTGHASGNLWFLDDHTIAIAASTGVEIVPFTGASAMFSTAEISSWDSLPGASALAVGTATGEAFVLATAPIHAAAHAALCHDRVVGMRFLRAPAGGVAYACRSGALGIWDPAHGDTRPLAQVEGRIDIATADPAGDYLVAGGGNGTVTVVDLQTRFVTSYKGQGFRLISLTAPTPEHPFAISGDAHGGVRAWPLPTRLASVIATTSERFTSAMFDPVTGAVAATTWLPELTIVEPTGAIHTARPHVPENLLLEPARTGRMFLAFGLSDMVELWSSETMTRTRVVDTGQGSVTLARFVGDGGDFLTSGHDGRLVRWRASGQATEVARVDQPIDRFAVAATGAIVFSTADGALWRSDETGRVVSLRPAGARITRIVAVSDPPRVYAGDAAGEVIAVDARSWRLETVVRGSDTVHEMAATGDGRTVAIAANDGSVYIGARAPGGELAWTAWQGRAREIAVAPDGLVVVTYSDGTIWLYAPGPGRWLCVSSGTMDLARIAVAPGGEAAIVSATDGRLIRIDLAAARQQLAGTGSLEPAVSGPATSRSTKP